MQPAPKAKPIGHPVLTLPPLQASHPLPRLRFLHTETSPHAHTLSRSKHSCTVTLFPWHTNLNQPWEPSPEAIKTDPLKPTLTGHCLTRDRLFQTSPWRFGQGGLRAARRRHVAAFPGTSEGPEVWGAHSLQIWLGSSPLPGNTGLLRRWSPATGALRSRHSPGRKRPTWLQFSFQA